MLRVCLTSAGVLARFSFAQTTGGGGGGLMTKRDSFTNFRKPQPFSCGFHFKAFITQNFYILHAKDVFLSEAVPFQIPVNICRKEWNNSALFSFGTQNGIFVSKKS